MKIRTYYLGVVNPIWELAHDVSEAGFNHNEEWLLEIREAAELLMSRSAFDRLQYQSAKTIYSIAKFLHAMAVKRVQVVT